MVDDKEDSKDDEYSYTLEQSLKDSMEVLKHNNALYKEKCDSLSVELDEAISKLNKLRVNHQFVINTLKSAFKDNPSLKNELIELRDFLKD